MKLQAFLSQRLVTPEGVRSGALLVENGLIRGIVAREQLPAETLVRDFGNAAVLPGLVDSHVHINEPGRTEWEGFETVTRAAAAGGYTLLVDMPLNCLPATTTVAALAAKRTAAQGKCLVDWAAWGGIVGDNHEEIDALAAAGVAGFKCFLIDPGIDGFAMVTEQELRGALPHVLRSGLPLLVHAELPDPVDKASQSLTDADWTRYVTYLQSRPEETELLAIRLLLSLSREYGFRVHVVHLSAASALTDLRAARSKGVAVTVETCPHYLYFCSENIPDGATLFKCAPPIRGQDNREQLWQGLREGLIDLVATDHSPCLPEMKRLEDGNYRTAWGGISSLSVALSVMWTGASRRGFTLGHIAQWMAEKPARLAGRAAQKGRLAEGCDADFVVFDPEAAFTVAAEHLHYKHAISPYEGERLYGVVRETYLRGSPIFREGEFPSKPFGQECR
jgi:allantoinase